MFVHNLPYMDTVSRYTICTETGDNRDKVQVWPGYGYQGRAEHTVLLLHLPLHTAHTKLWPVPMPPMLHRGRQLSNVTFLCCRSGRCPARYMMQKLLPLVQSGELADATQVITHRMPMSQGVQAYKMFDQKKDGMVKCVLDPWAWSGVMVQPY